MKRILLLTTCLLGTLVAADTSASEQPQQQICLPSMSQAILPVDQPQQDSHLKAKEMRCGIETAEISPQDYESQSWKERFRNYSTELESALDEKRKFFCKKVLLLKEYTAPNKKQTLGVIHDEYAVAMQEIIKQSNLINLKEELDRRLILITDKIDDNRIGGGIEVITMAYGPESQELRKYKEVCEKRKKLEEDMLSLECPGVVRYPNVYEYILVSGAYKKLSKLSRKMGLMVHPIGYCWNFGEKMEVMAGMPGSFKGTFYDYVDTP